MVASDVDSAVGDDIVSSDGDQPDVEPIFASPQPPSPVQNSLPEMPTLSRIDSSEVRVGPLRSSPPPLWRIHQAATSASDGDCNPLIEALESLKRAGVEMHCPSPKRRQPPVIFYILFLVNKLFSFASILQMMAKNPDLFFTSASS